MKLSELARETGATTASLKFWMREGVLPAGELRNQTTAVYGQRHLDRVALIQTLRSEFDASIAGIRGLTSLIDRPDAVPLDVMEACQVIATGLAIGEVHDEYAELIGELHDRVGWIRFDSLAAGVLAHALAASARVGYPYSLAALEQYARMLDPIAESDIGAIQPEGTLDVMARNLLVAAAAQNRVLIAMNQLAHTAAAVRRARG
ncbi:MerR family transcriptional regulator [Microbacterium bovistercoris]|uniref:MerR family transcriptional regulator n=1 Tax=Microbacterium bovistercoris TaxID=2293570 RepID=A0A371NTY1_9MICO|nr:MerR family transcriptional regulator [Microbacterium bovistercoris]REJ05720.1 MerR family transcriptional regulator [Microbacterium bovistercoris]